MKNQNRLSFRQILISILLLFLFTVLVCLPFLPGWDRIKFRNFSKTLYIQEMSSNTLSLHYSLAAPASFGISDYPVTLPILIPGSEEARPDFLEELLADLRKIHRTNLTLEEGYAYDCLESSLVLSKALAQFPYYADPLSPVQGIQCQLPILFSEYEFRSRRDVEEYLTLLSQTGIFFDSLIQYEQEKAARGLSMSLSALRSLQIQCDTIVTSDSLKSSEHFLQTGFLDRLEELSHTVALTDQEKQDYTDRNNAILRQVVAPAYQDLKQSMKALEEYAPLESSGLCHLPNGKEYYRLLLAQETGSGKTPEEIRPLLEQKIIEETEAIRRLSTEYPGCLTNLREESYQDIGLGDPYSILEDLKERMLEEFPPIGEETGNALPQAFIKTVSPSLQASSAPAFYLTAPLDKTDVNVIYINPMNASSELELYTTLAHEGYPGHLYQNAFMAAHLLSLPESRIRQLISCGGYLEGWALYVEQHSFDYASRLLASQGRTADAVCVQIEKHNRSLLLALYSLLDLMIHYEGATPQIVADRLKPFGLKDTEAIQSLFDYICECPCNYPKYYLGYLEILELKQDARTLWDQSYTELAFHTYILKWGPAEFSNLRRILEQKNANIAISDVQ